MTGVQTCALPISLSKVNYNEENQPVSLDILAVATSKSTISKYRDFCSKVGLTLVTAIPDVLSYRNIYMNIKEAKPKEYGILDLGYTSSHVFIYNEDIYETTRVIEYGGRAIDVAIAESFNIDKDLASQKKLSDISSVNALSDVERLYNEIAVAVMRAVNFYKYNNPNSELKDLYVCGGLSNIKALIDIIKEVSQLNIYTIDTFVPEKDQYASICALAMGTVLQ